MENRLGMHYILNYFVSTGKSDIDFFTNFFPEKFSFSPIQIAFENLY